VRHRQLGSSDLQVSEISLGSSLTYGGGGEREQAEAYVTKAFEEETLRQIDEILGEVVAYAGAAT
jgi:aryl-alcohol dehydrogenase-like predicted oxidoreductase